ncbi:hypothetical protein DL766_005771 [Monosporascus sp. MC13-8B]|uniref:Uncharacterized protein n=1 Tax=Monosporascus cannonballus TaxID=155416 RepID=A0ABY0HIX4_9PEZI|nr:hypothetical protein DL763_006414 [Monosporascus cannonballus]RYO91797.1 hypothetical protein DL762_002016 [Monosporascus cannonballus]RYP28618.1 hypothetical protein DL766_005771 [Monosporascus sp. MC13-8B]
MTQHQEATPHGIRLVYGLHKSSWANIIASLKDTSSTQFFPPEPQYAEIPLLYPGQGLRRDSSRANSGMGKELGCIPYAGVYAACRSEEKRAEAIHKIRRAKPSSKGELVLQHLSKVQCTVQ